LDVFGVQKRKGEKRGEVREEEEEEEERRKGESTGLDESL